MMRDKPDMVVLEALGGCLDYMDREWAAVQNHIAGEKETWPRDPRTGGYTAEVKYANTVQGTRADVETYALIAGMPASERAALIEMTPTVWGVAQGIWRPASSNIRENVRLLRGLPLSLSWSGTCAHSVLTHMTSATPTRFTRIYSGHIALLIQMYLRDIAHIPELRKDGDDQLMQTARDLVIATLCKTDGYAVLGYTYLVGMDAQKVDALGFDIWRRILKAPEAHPEPLRKTWALIAWSPSPAREHWRRVLVMR